MASKIKMPKLSDTMSVGVMNEWKKKEGDTIAPGDILAEVETDKANMELENFESGVLLKILVQKGGKVPVGGTIAIVGQKGENIDALIKEAQAEGKAAPTPAAPPPKAAPTPTPTPTPTPAPQPTLSAPPPAPAIERKGRIKASPLARRMAEAKGVDLGTIYGSGPGGRIVKKDIEPLLAGLAGGAAPSQVSQQLPPLVTKDIPLSQMRQTIATRLSESKGTIPHFYVTVEVDMRRAVELRETLKEAEVGPVSYNDMILRACALALRRYPEVNASFMGEFIRLHGNIHIGMAVAIPDGLITPVIRDADKKNLLQIASEARELATRAKEKKLKPNEYTGSTFTTSNMGMFDVEDFSAIINPPEAAILAISSILEKPVVEKGHVTAGKRMKLTLSCDHRAVDGATAARFLKEVRRLLENPVLLIL